MSEISKMVMIAYNEAVDAEVMDALSDSCAMNNYTKIPGVFGKGTHSGTHLGDDIWPGRNNLLLVSCSAREAQTLFACIKQLRAKLGAEGVKAFVLPVEAVTD